MTDKMIKCAIMRDYWNDEGIRHRAGAEVDVPIEAALEGIESGALKRVKAEKPAKKAPEKPE